jgi:ABC-type microcin C transport system permease subunit YejB
MEWLQTAMIAGSTIGACWMMHRENKEMATKFANETNGLARDMAKETKDFHGRLCALEERYIQMMQKLLEFKKGDL